ncbi:hypothetical protein [Streptomyces buecherae]|uniref:hypothetical protein n=1 Tax=Streptomyces buecherae TaxID=2763006 RepID=UPI003656554B
MRFVPRTLGAAVIAVGAVVAVLAIGSAANESPRPTLVVSPAHARPGDEVEVRAWGCEGRAGVVASRAFVVDGRLAPEPKGGDGLFAEAMIRSAADGGTYDVTVRCDGRAGVAVGRVHVGAAGQRPGDMPAVARPDRAGDHALPLPARSPVAPVRAGGGGTAGEPHAVAAAEEEVPRDGDVGVAEAYGLALAGGTALTLGGMALHRRGRAGRPTG